MKPFRLGILSERGSEDPELGELALWARSSRASRRSCSRAPRAPGGPARPSRSSRRWSALCSRRAPSIRAGARAFSRALPEAADAAAAAAHGLDLLVVGGESALPPGLEDAARLGAVSAALGSGALGRGRAAGFWECLKEEPATGFTLYRHRGDGGEALLSGSFRTRPYHALNRAHVRRKAFAHLRALVRRAAAGEGLPPAGTRLQFRDEPEPGPLDALRYALAVGVRGLGKALRHSLRVRDRWGLALKEGDWRLDAAAWAGAAALPNPPGRMWADPFLCSRDGRTFCFVEDLPYASGKAFITALELVGGRAKEHGVALREPFHLSFPFLFEHGGQLYMCPETSAARQIRVYRCAEFPLKWELHAVLMEDVCAADTLLFEKDGRWWMLTSIDESGTSDHNSELYLFSAESPFSPSWTPHPRNPVRLDPLGGRNAGLLRRDGKLYRVGQRQGFDRYGEGLLVYELAALSETEYEERPVGGLDPVGRGLIGTHHLSSDGRVSVVDRCTREFVP